MADLNRADRWRLAHHETLMREWDGEIALFDSRTGDTHYLDHRATAVFKIIRDRVCSLEEIQSNDASQRLSLTAPALMQVIARLREAELIEPVCG